MKLLTYRFSASNRRSALVATMSIGLVFGTFVQAPLAFGAKKAKPAPTIAKVGAVAATVAPSTAPSTTAATTTTTTLVPGKAVTFFFEAPLVGPGSNPPPHRACVDASTCVSATVTGAPREVSGDLIGFWVHTSSVVTMTDKQIGIGIGVFSGAIEGCGVGTVAVRFTSLTPPFLGLPAIGSKFPGESRWEILSDTSSRGLTPISGSGTVDFVLSGPNKVTTTVSGRMVCSPLRP